LKSIARGNWPKQKAELVPREIKVSFDVLAKARSSSRTPPLAAATIFFVLGGVGLIGAAWGYGFFLVSMLLIGFGILAGGIALFSDYFSVRGALPISATAMRIGGWFYVFAVAALAGYFVRESVEGRIQWHWIVFGPAALAAIVVLDLGIYRVLYLRNKPTLERYSHALQPERLDKPSLRATLIDEVVLHRTLLTVSRLRWLRHQLIFWGFMAMLGLEAGAVIMREVSPALGFYDIWHTRSHPVRLVWDFAFDMTGAMVLFGCLLALFYRYQVNGTPDQKYTDTPTVCFLLAVVVSGFLVEGARIAGAPSVHDLASPVGLVFSWFMAPLVRSAAFPVNGLWTVHALLSLGFIAYVPLKRLVHSCAVPVGRLMNSQKAMLAAKKDRSLRGLIGRRSKG
jgi:MFS family permease